MCSDLVAFFIIKEYGTAGSGYLRKEKEMDTDTEFRINNYSSVAAQAFLSSWPFSLCFYVKKTQTI